MGQAHVVATAVVDAEAAARQRCGLLIDTSAGRDHEQHEQHEHDTCTNMRQCMSAHVSSLAHMLVIGDKG